jgi:hypothetical protein
VVLVSRAQPLKATKPKEVDVVVSDSEPRHIVQVIDEMASGRWHKRTGKNLPDRLSQRTIEPRPTQGLA